MNNENQRSLMLEIKSMTADGTFAGYASVFNVIDGQRDIMRPGAFKTTLSKRNYPVQLLWQHQWDNPIGVIEQLFEDSRGLYIEGKLLLDVVRANDAYALLKAGAVKGLSIGFTVQKAQVHPDVGIRELLAVDLWEISLVTLPANDAAQVTVVKSRKRSAPKSEMMLQLLSAVKRAEQVLQVQY